jgi:hypothetical protein
MNKALKSLLITLLIGSVWSGVEAQQTAGNNTILKKYQDSLVLAASKVFDASGNVQRFDQNAKFIKLLVTALKTPSSFNYGFDSLKTISVVRSPDNTFRIFSWYVPADEGTYRFFGTIQMATKDGALKLYPLIDATAEMKDSNQVTTNKVWYGARYYEIVPIVVSGRNTSYALLGWKGNNNKTSKKVIEILSFEKDVAQFGKPVFLGPSGAAISKNRIIFEYNKLNSMTLRMDKNEGMIVFDHLAPFAPDMAGNFEYYASDSSFDGYRLVGDKLKLTENLELKNDPSILDDFYVDPKMKNPPVTKKF